MKTEITFPKHLNSLHLTHNQHKAYYEPIEEYIKCESRGDRSKEFESQGEILAAIATDEIWELQWYPENSISSWCVCASTLENCLSYALKVEAGG